MTRNCANCGKFVNDYDGICRVCHCNNGPNLRRQTSSSKKRVSSYSPERFVTYDSPVTNLYAPSNSSFSASSVLPSVSSSITENTMKKLDQCVSAITQLASNISTISEKVDSVANTQQELSRQCKTLEQRLYAIENGQTEGATSTAKAANENFEKDTLNEILSLIKSFEKRLTFIECRDTATETSSTSAYVLQKLNQMTPFWKWEKDFWTKYGFIFFYSTLCFVVLKLPALKVVIRRPAYELL